MLKQKTLLFLMLAFLINPAWAHPVINKGGVNFESESNTDMTELRLGYSYNPQFAVMGHYIKENLSEYQFVRTNFRLYRQNEEISQFNIYLSLGAGWERFEQKYTPAEIGEFDIDWESRDYYLAGLQRFIQRHDDDLQPNKNNLSHAKLRAGFSPYQGDFENLNLWFITQFDKQTDKSWVTTPLLRAYYKNVLWEIGASLNGSYQFNLMLHL